MANELECLLYSVQHEDEGVCVIVRMGPHRILLDCGAADISSITKKNSPADLVLISHAHPDHCRGLLSLNRAFPLLPIYTSEVTSKLLPLNWTELGAAENITFCQALPLRSPVEVQEGLVVELFPAGHLPGAVAILLTYQSPERDYKLLYTGDFFLSNSRLVDGLRLEELRGLNLDVLLIEGSYGTSRHPHRRHQENQIAERINRAIIDRSSVLLPTPALGLGQELLMLLRSHHHFTGQDIDIWVDGEVSTGCDAYLGLLSHLPASVQNFARHQPLFWDERVRPRVRRLKVEDLDTLGSPPCIVLTDYKSDLNKYINQGDGASWVVLFPEKMASDLENPLVQTETYLLAQHSDGPGTTQLIHNLRPQHVVFIHGDPTYLADLTTLEELQNRYHVHSPLGGTLVELPIGETLIQSPPPVAEANYQGELTELETIITIILPREIREDPRWQDFADTGLVEARWQGEDLVIKGLSQRYLLNRNSLDTARSKYHYNWSEIECCGTCKHQRGQRCWNAAAPLYNFKVTLEGYCPAFERLSENES
ncbi:Beta-lactamase-like protein [Raphidiopsis brookii D9]|nr:Beta-lactamase-like protein [Raphidiopsis brookii D9]